MKIVVWLLVLLLVILHQDNWNWNSDTLVLGFMPIGLFYHACLSIAAGFVWLLACQFAWPDVPDELNEDPGEGIHESAGEIQR